MSSIPHIPGVYLIHMDRPVADGHPAQHYIGWSFDVFVRLSQHRRNQGARILEVCNERGITYKIARLWKGQNRVFERRLKRRKNARKLCPICNPKTARMYPVYRPLKPFFLMDEGTRCPF